MGWDTQLDGGREGLKDGWMKEKKERLLKMLPIYSCPATNSLFSVQYDQSEI